MKSDLKKLFKEYISQCIYSRLLSVSTIKSYENAVNLFFNIMPEVLITQDLSMEMLNEFFKRLQTRKRIVGKNTEKIGIKNSTARMYWNKLNTFFMWLIIKKEIRENPLAKVKMPHPIYEDDRELQNQDILKILSVPTLHSMNSLVMKRDTLMIYILLYTGVRAGEFISLQVRDINFDDRSITIRGETSKSKKTRIIPINSTLILHLKNYIIERNSLGYTTPYLFVSTTDKKELSRDGLKHWTKRMIKLSGVKFHLHRFRHSFACNLARKGAPIIKIAKVMGHSSIKMTESYLRSVKTEDAREYIDKLVF